MCIHPIQLKSTMASAQSIHDQLRLWTIVWISNCSTNAIFSKPTNYVRQQKKPYSESLVCHCRAKKNRFTLMLDLPDEHSHLSIICLSIYLLGTRRGSHPQAPSHSLGWEFSLRSFVMALGTWLTSQGKLLGGSEADHLLPLPVNRDEFGSALDSSLIQISNSYFFLYSNERQIG